MPDVQALSASIGADVAQFLAAMQAAAASVAQLKEGHAHAQVAADAHAHAAEHLTEAVHHASQAHEEHAGAIGMAVEAYHLAAEAVAKLVETFGEFVTTAIEAANEMDPKGAIEWTRSVEGLKSSFLTLAGTIGKELRPALEAVMGTATQMADRLLQVDWAKFGSALLAVLRDVGAGIKEWASFVLDTISYPFRQLVYVVETAMAGLMSGIGTVLTKLGGGDLGKKLGLSSFSGDAFQQTAGEMVKQADNFQKSFAGAASEIGHGLGQALDVALKSVNESSSMKALRASLHGGGGEAQEKVETDQQLAMKLNAFMAQLKVQQDTFKEQQQADQAHIASIRQAAAEAKQGAMENFNLAKQHVADARSQLAADQSAGNLPALAGDQQAVAAAMAALTAAGLAASAAAADAASKETELAEKLATNAKKAREDYAAARAAAVAADASAAAAPDNKVLQLVKQEKDARAAMFESEKDTVVGQALSAEQAASRLRAQSHREAATIDVAAAHEASAIQLAATKAAMDFYVKTVTGLGAHALGGVGGNALDAGIKGAAAGGPIGAAVGVGASLLESSASFKKLSDTINKLLQEVADTVGKLIGPLVPVIEEVSKAIKPLIDALGDLFLAGGNILAAAIRPLIPVIKMAAQLVADILEPLATLLNLIQPLIPIVVTISELMFLLANTAFLPLIAGIKLLSPAIQLLNNVVHDFAEAVASVWNSIVGAVQSVIRGIANILPDKLGGNSLRDFGNSLDGLKIQVDGVAGAFAQQRAQQDAQTLAFVNAMGGTGQGGEWGQVLDAMAAQAQADMGAAGSAVTNLGTAATAAAAALTAVQQAGVTKSQDQLKMQIDEAALAFAQTHGGSAATIADLTAKVAKDSQQVTSDGWKQAAEIAKSNGDYATYIADMARAAYTDATATQINTQATQALTAVLTNTPAGFRVAKYEGDVGGIGSSNGTDSRTGPSVGGSSNARESHNYYGSITVIANTPAEFEKAIRAHIAKNKRGLGVI